MLTMTRLESLLFIFYKINKNSTLFTLHCKLIKIEFVTSWIIQGGCEFRHLVLQGIPQDKVLALSSV